MAKFSFNNLFGSLSKIISEAEVVEKKDKKHPQQKAHDDEIQNAIIVLASAVVRCNHNYTTETELFIYQFLSKQFGATGVKQKMKAIEGHLEAGPEPLLRIACKELVMLTTHQSRVTITEFLFGVAAVDDFVNAKETRCIHRLAGYIGISEYDFKELRFRFMSENNPYKLLGIDDECSMEEVRVAYRKMVLKHHPDKREAHISEEEASVKFRQIQHAFETIKKLREEGK